MKRFFHFFPASVLFCFLAGSGLIAEGKDLPYPTSMISSAVGTNPEHGIRDPFQPDESVRGKLHTPSVDPSQLRVQAILYDPGNPKAIISGQVVGLGDRIYEYSVSKISKSKVCIKRGHREYQLFLKLPFE